jgi:hypothetical protein
MKIKDDPWFYLYLKKEKIIMMQGPLLEIERPKNVTRIIAPSAEREPKVQLIHVKNR